MARMKSLWETKGLPESIRAKDQFSSQLRAILELAFSHSIGSLDLDRKRLDLRKWYKKYLLTMHMMIRGSVPLMVAAETISLKLDRDPLRDELARYYRHHAKEEAHHDDWLLNDIEVTGTSKESALSTIPAEAIAELVGSQYYWIHHWHPVCLLGYIAVMEGYPPDRETVDNLISRTAYPKSAFRTLAKHSYLDPLHRESLNVALDSLPLDRKHREWITLNAIYTLRKWEEIAEDIIST
jgi:hypothetical protein